MDPVFAWIEQTPLSIYVREDLYAFFVILIFHSLGMGLLVGGGLAVSLGAVGFAKGAALEKFRGFFPVMWVGLALAVPAAAKAGARYVLRATVSGAGGVESTGFVLIPR